MKWIEYDYVCNASKGINLHKKVEYNGANLAIAQVEACDGKYTITEDNEKKEIQPIAVEYGGTGGVTAKHARENLGAAAKILADDVASALNLDKGASTDDAFKYLSRRLLKVGDTLRTFRTDLSDNWLRCNGASFDPQKYPELAAVTPHYSKLIRYNPMVSNPLFGDVKSYIEAGGYQVISYVDADDDDTYIAYSTDYFKTYQRTWMYDGEAESSAVYFVNGYWVFVCTTSAGYIKVRSRFDTPVGEWTEDISGATSEGYGKVLGMWYNGDRYIIAASGTGRTGYDKKGCSYPYIITSSDLSFSKLNVTQLHSTSGNYRGFLITDKYVIFVGYTDDTYNEIKRLNIVYAPIGNVLSVTYRSEVIDVPLVAGTIKYLNGRYIAFAETGIYYFDDIVNGALQLTAFVSGDDYQSKIRSGNIVYVRDEYMFLYSNGSYVRLAYSKDITDVNSFKILSSGHSDFDNSSRVESDCTFEVHEGLLPVVTNRVVALLPIFAVPNTDQTVLYEYIKVKDGV